MRAASTNLDYSDIDLTTIANDYLAAHQLRTGMLTASMFGECRSGTVAQ